MPVSNETPATRRAQVIETELQSRTDRLAKVLSTDLQSDDATNVSTSDWYDLIRRRWSDPAFRQVTADRIGDVAFYKAAMKAFGLNHPDSHFPMHAETVNAAAAHMAGNDTLFPVTPPDPQPSPLLEQNPNLPNPTQV